MSISLLTVIGVDADISQETRESIIASLKASFPTSAATEPHHLLPPTYEPKFSDLIKAEHTRIAASKPMTGIDKSRYEALDAPTTDSLDDWRRVLNQAYTSYTYLNGRAANLTLLDQHGRNAWLIGNAHLETELGALEKELARAQEQAAQIENERKMAQEDVRGEMEVLEDTWRKGVSRALEAEIAAEDLRRRILEERRKAAGSA
jgi:pre-mRNA-splicing factor SPF27